MMTGPAAKVRPEARVTGWQNRKVSKVDVAEAKHPMVIQIVLILGVAIGGGALMRSSGGARHQAIRRLLLLGFIVLAIVSVLYPKLLTHIASWVGVGRGTDLVLYLLFVLVLGFMATTYRRFRDLEQQITVLTRRLALDEAILPDPLVQRAEAANTRRSDDH
jgi:small membrane protein